MRKLIFNPAPYQASQQQFIDAGWTIKQLVDYGFLAPVPAPRSRNKREGQYAGYWEGSHFRCGSNDAMWFAPLKEKREPFAICTVCYCVFEWTQSCCPECGGQGA